MQSVDLINREYRPRLRRSKAAAAPLPVPEPFSQTPVQITLTVRASDVPACLEAARPFVV